MVCICGCSVSFAVNVSYAEDNVYNYMCKTLQCDTLTPENGQEVRHWQPTLLYFKYLLTILIYYFSE